MVDEYYTGKLSKKFHKNCTYSRKLFYVHKDASLYRVQIVAAAAQIVHKAEGMAEVSDYIVAKRGIVEAQGIVVQEAQGLLA